MSRKQKALAGIGALAFLLTPSAAMATETESVHNQTLTTAGSLGISELSLEKPEFMTDSLEDIAIPIDVSRSEPVYLQPTTGELIIEAAMSQLGVHQDCTDLVQNSLAMLGIVERRDAGGFDFGTGSAIRVGYEIPASEARPGDIASIGPMDGGHVWIVLDPATNLGIHGGYEKSIVGGDGRTVIGTDPIHLLEHTVVRLY